MPPAGIAAVETMPDAAGQIRAWAQMQCWRNPKIAPFARALDHARHTDQAVSAAWRDRTDNRMRGAAAIITRLREEGRLHSSWDTGEAAALLSEFTSFRVWDDLVNESGLQPDRYAEIITTAALAALASPIGDHARAGPSPRHRTSTRRSAGGVTPDSPGHGHLRAPSAHAAAFRYVPRWLMMRTLTAGSSVFSGGMSVAELITEPQPNVIESSAGFSVRVLGRTGLRYQEGDRSVWIDSEVLVKPRAIVMYKDSIKYWEGCDPGKVSDADRDRIADNIKRAFEACGYELQVQVPDYEWLAWYSEHKRAAEQRHRNE